MRDDVKKLIEKSKDKNFLMGKMNRKSAVKQLGRIGTPDVVIPLVDALEDEENEVKRNAFLALSGLEDPISLEVLRNLYIKTENKALWQVIKNKNKMPAEFEDRIVFLAKARKYEDLAQEVNERNFDRILEIFLDCDMDDFSQPLTHILDKSGDETKVKIVKKFLQTKDDSLFIVIDEQNWYPDDLKNKIMFLLKTDMYDAVRHLLDGGEFRQVLDILIDPTFAMKKQAMECLSHLENVVIIDEICKIYMSEEKSLPHLGGIIFQNDWKPQKVVEQIFFFFKAPFLKSFFISENIDVMMIGGYLEIPQIRKELTNKEYIPVAESLSSLAHIIYSKEKPTLRGDDPLMLFYHRVKEFFNQPDDKKIIAEVCEEFIKTNSPYLSYVISKKNWSPDDIKEQMIFYLRSNQLNKVMGLGNKVIGLLYEVIKNEDKEAEDIRKRAIVCLRNIKSPGGIEALFDLYFENFDPRLEMIINNNKLAPQKDWQKASYFIYTGKMEDLKDLDPDGFKVLTKVYKKFKPIQRLKLVENFLINKSKEYLNFLISLFIVETNSVVLRMLCQVFRVYPERIYKPMGAMIPQLNKTALREVIRVLGSLNTNEAYHLLFRIARVKKGYTCLMILKILERGRWQPDDQNSRGVFFNLYKYRDGILRLMQNRIVDVDPEVRLHTADLFMLMGDEKYLNVLLKYVDDPVEEVRAAVAHCIGFLCASYPKSSLAILESFGIGNIYMIFNDVRKAFITTDIVDKIYILKRNFEVGNIVLKAFTLGAMEVLCMPEFLPTLYKALQNKSKAVRYYALQALYYLSDPESKKDIFPCLQDSDEKIRNLAAEALANIADDELCEQVVSILNKDDPIIVDGMIDLLGRVDPIKYRPIFERIIKSPVFDGSSKWSAVISLGRVNDPEAREFLKKEYSNVHLLDDNSRNEQPYIKAFGISGSPEFYSYMEEALRIGEWDMRCEVIKAVSSIPDRVALVVIIKALNDKSGWVQLQALESLGLYLNNHFKFKMTEKDLKFVGAMITMLKKFKLNQIIDKNTEEYNIMSKLTVNLLLLELTQMYLKYREVLKNINS